ncbi:protein rolling stone-like [Glandiceps talaboti]
MERFGFNYDNPRAFDNPQWRCIPLWLFVAYRLAIATYIVAYCIIYTVISICDIGVYFLIYFPNWSLMFLTIYLIISSLATFQHCMSQRVSTLGHYRYDDYNERTELTTGLMRRLSTPLHLKLSWFFYNIATVSALGVTIAYIVTSANLIGREDSDVAKFHICLLNTLVVLVELGIAAMPMRIAHCIYVTTIVLLYIILTIAFSIVEAVNPYNGQSVVYIFLDYKNNVIRSVLVVCVLLLSTVVIHLLLWGIFKFKLYIYTRPRCSDSREPSSFLTSYDSGRDTYRVPKTEVAEAHTSLTNYHGDI